jgi:hypothetical protein
VETGVIVYPNPSKGIATAAIPQEFGTDIQITVMEMGSGKIVKDFRTGPGDTQLDFSGMANGMYIIRITSQNASATHRLVLAK